MSILFQRDEQTMKVEEQLIWPRDERASLSCLGMMQSIDGYVSRGRNSEVSRLWDISVE